MSRPRRRPYPFDLIWGNVGLVLGRPDPKSGGPLVATKPPTLDQSQPPTYGYTAENPITGRDHSWDDLSLGFGTAVQGDIHERKYHYAIGADCSIQGMVQKGPLISTLVPAVFDNANPIGGFVELGGILYARNGRYLLERVSDTSWSPTGGHAGHDFGAGTVIADAAQVTSNADSVQRIYLGLGDTAHMWRYDATNGWVQHASISANSFGFGTVAAGVSLWVGVGNNKVQYADVDTDLWTAANFSAAYTLGDGTYPIRKIVTEANGTLLFFKDDGIYILDTSYYDHNLYPLLTKAPDSSNGSSACQFLSDVYVGLRDGAYRIHTDNTIEQIGPERVTSNMSPVIGRITAACGHDTHNLYAALYNEDTATSYLLKFGSWIRASDPPEWILPRDSLNQRVEVWNGSISPAYSGKKITALYKSAVGAPTNHTRMYLGFSDGTIGWFTLPCSVNPYACSSYQYGTADGTVYLPRFTAMFGNDLKAFQSVTVTGVMAESGAGTATEWVEFDYRTDQAQPYLGLGATLTPYGYYAELATHTYLTLAGQTYTQLATGSAQAPTQFKTSPRQMVEFPTTVSGTYLDAAMVLRSSGSGTPLVQGVGMRYNVRPYLRMLYEFLVLADRYATKRDGTRMRIGPESIVALFESAVNGGAATVILPDESTVFLGVQEYQKTEAWDERAQRWTAALKVGAAQFQTGLYPAVPVLGTYQRLTAYSYAQLANQTYQAITSL